MEDLITELTVFAYGNPSRGDDGIGPWLADRLRDYAFSQPFPFRLNLVEGFQLQVEDIFELEADSVALFIDASVNGPRDIDFTEVSPRPYQSHTSHSLQPFELLGLYRSTLAREAPVGFQLSIQGESFELGELITPTALTRAEQAWDVMETLMENPSLRFWRALARQAVFEANELVHA